MARLRLWNDPVAEQYSNGTDIPFTPYCNISGVVQLAQRAIAAGLDVCGHADTRVCSVYC